MHTKPQRRREPIQRIAHGYRESDYYFMGVKVALKKQTAPKRRLLYLRLEVCGQK